LIQDLIGSTVFPQSFIRFRISARGGSGMTATIPTPLVLLKSPRFLAWSSSSTNFCSAFSRNY